MKMCLEDYVDADSILTLYGIIETRPEKQIFACLNYASGSPLGDDLTETYA